MSYPIHISQYNPILLRPISDGTNSYTNSSINNRFSSDDFGLGMLNLSNWSELVVKGRSVKFQFRVENSYGISLSDSKLLLYTEKGEYVSEISFTSANDVTPSGYVPDVTIYEISLNFPTVGHYQVLATFFNTEGTQHNFNSERIEVIEDVKLYQGQPITRLTYTHFQNDFNMIFGEFDIYLRGALGDAEPTPTNEESSDDRGYPTITQTTPKQIRVFDLNESPIYYYEKMAWIFGLSDLTLNGLDRVVKVGDIELKDSNKTNQKGLSCRLQTVAFDYMVAEKNKTVITNSSKILITNSDDPKLVTTNSI